MNAEIENQYPSTADAPKIMGAQDDPVLAILAGARKRYSKGMSVDEYITVSGNVCAMGAIVREAGFSRKDLEDKEGWSMSTFPSFVDTYLDDAAKEAITLVNASAIALYPQSEDLSRDRDGETVVPWGWPLEWLNQELNKTDAREAVMRCYDDAIAKRRGTPIPTMVY